MSNKIKTAGVIIFIIIVGVIIGITTDKMNRYENQSQNDLEERIANDVKKNSVEINEVEENNTEYENIVEENVTEENLVEENNTSKNEIEENTVKENTTKENTKKEDTTNKTQENTSSNSTEKDSEKKAISLAKKKWGNTNDDVYFDVEDESKGVYTIVVRDNNTTVEMVTYKVDINKNTVTEQ